MSCSTGSWSRISLAASTRGRHALTAAALVVIAAQVPGFAELSSPGPGEVVSGLVTLRGTADHPAFHHFELSFAYAEDSTETWFPIGEPVDTRVIDGRLALWDTESITDGDYTLRLQVWLQDGRWLQAVVAGVRVRNYTPEPTPAPVQGEVGAPTAVVATPSPITGVAPAPPKAASSGLNPFWVGAIGGGGVLLVLAAYARVVPAMRLHLARLRMRRVHRRLDRARSRGRRP